MKKCLVCNEKKRFSDKRCKMCGMGVKNAETAHDFIFCSAICEKIFMKLYDTLSLKQKTELLEKEIVL